MSDTLFKCRECSEINDTDDKRGITISNYSTKASARVSLCAKCFTKLVQTFAFKYEWKDWPKRE